MILFAAFVVAVDGNVLVMTFHPSYFIEHTKMTLINSFQCLYYCVCEGE